MKTTEIKCDACEADLTYTGNCVDYRLVLGSEIKPAYPNAWAVTAMGIYPPVDRTHHFCSLTCLDKWSDRRRHTSKLWRDFMEEWKREKGTQHKNMFGSGGVTWSYPDVPDDIRATKNSEFAAAALAAFPK